MAPKKRTTKAIPIEKKKVTRVSSLNLFPLAPQAKPRIPPGVQKTLSTAKIDTDLLDEVHSDEFSRSIILEADRVIEMINQGLTYGRLNDRQRRVLFLFFYMTNPLISRIINIHTNLPLSSLTLSKPKTDNVIVQDYIHDFYERMLGSVNWERTLKKITKYYWLFSTGQSLIEDDFKFEKDSDVEDESFIRDLKLESMNEEDKVDIQRITDKYIAQDELVSTEEVDKVLSKLLLNYNKNYKGLHSIRVLNPFNILTMNTNYEIDFNTYTLPKSDYIKKYHQTEVGQVYDGDEKDKKDRGAKRNLHKIGYSYSYIEANLDPETTTLEVSNDPYDDLGFYVAEFKSETICNSWLSIFDPVLMDLIKYYNASRKESEKVILSNRKVNIVTAVEASEDQVGELDDKVIEAATSQEGSNITVNYEVKVETVDFTIKDQIDLADIRAQAQSNVMMGTGTPDTLLTSTANYGAGYLKLEVLNEEFLAFREDLKRFVENEIFKPIAIKRGFVTRNNFGNLVPLYPTINFESNTIINKTDYLDLLKGLAEDGKIPWSKFLAYVGIDPEDNDQGLKKEQERKETMGLEEGSEGGSSEGFDFSSDSDIGSGAGMGGVVSENPEEGGAPAPEDEAETVIEGPAATEIIV